VRARSNCSPSRITPIMKRIQAMGGHDCYSSQAEGTCNQSHDEEYQRAISRWKLPVSSLAVAGLRVSYVISYPPDGQLETYAAL
jgi:hypothetical protein